LLERTQKADQLESVSVSGVLGSAADRGELLNVASAILTCQGLAVDT
jgi:hypothetical protein